MPTFIANPDRDATITDLNPTFNYGVFTTLLLDWFNSGVGECRALLAWNVSSIPVGDKVSSATLDFVVQNNTLTGSVACSAYAMNLETPSSPGVVFIEGSGNGSATGDGATWNTINGVDNWIDPGAQSDIDIPSASAFTIAPSETTKSINVTTAIQAALDYYRDMNGRIALLLKRNTYTGALTNYRLWSKNAGTPANRPVLTIVHSTPVSRRGLAMPIIRRRRSNFVR